MKDKEKKIEGILRKFGLCDMENPHYKKTPFQNFSTAKGHYNFL